DLICKTRPIDLAGHPAEVDPGISAVGPASGLQRGAERRTEPSPLGIIGTPEPDRDLAPLALLRARSQWPRRRAANQPNDPAPAKFAHGVVLLRAPRPNTWQDGTVSLLQSGMSHSRVGRSLGPS